MNRLLLTPLAFGFRMGTSLRRAAYERRWLGRRRLTRPVVSVGNLSLGGTGKTPLIALLATALLRHGSKPSILTRGYGRPRKGGLIVIAPAPGRRPNAREVGDEPALLAQKLPSIPIVVGVNRYRSGRLAEEQFDVDVHLLDDGFQHLALERDVDIVLLDATEKPSDSALLPVGRLREPYSALKWADLIVITRSDQGDCRDHEARVRDINPSAPVFHSFTQLRRILDVATGRIHHAEEFAGEPVSAFCGLGNPRAFFDDLQRWGFTIQGRSNFRDHHVYSQSDITRLAAWARASGARALVTTEKDAVNFPSPWEVAIPIFACEIESEIREEKRFEEELLARLQARRTKDIANLKRESGTARLQARRTKACA